MRRMAFAVIVAALALPCLALAGTIEERDVGAMSLQPGAALPPAMSVAPPASSGVDTEAPVAAAAVTQAAPAQAPVKVKASIAPAKPAVAAKSSKASAAKAASSRKALPKATVVAKATPPPKKKKAAAVEPPAPAPRHSSRELYNGGRREGHFQVGFVGPGFAVANHGIGPMLYDAVEGDYYFWEHLAVGFGIEVATEFKDATILSFAPHARYVWDLASHPRWAVYAKAGVGLALANGKHAAADIAIPGGGFWWKWTDRLSVGADSAMHVYVRSNTTFGWTLSPAFRYQF